MAITWNEFWQFSFPSGSTLSFLLKEPLMNLYRIEPEDDDAFTYVLADTLMEALIKYKAHVAKLINDELAPMETKVTPNEINDPVEVVLESGGDYLVL